MSPEFFLLGSFKERVYSNETRSFEDFKHNTEGALTKKLLDVLQKIRENSERLSSEAWAKFQHLL
jgi:hypothetical protein